MNLYVNRAHRSSVLSLLILQASCPGWKKAKNLAQGLRERSQITLSPGAGDERFWDCFISYDLNQEHRDIPRIWAIGSRVSNLEVHHR